MYTMEALNTATGYQKVPLKDGRIIGLGYGDVQLIGNTYYRNYVNLNPGINTGAKFMSYSNTSFIASLDDQPLNLRTYFPIGVPTDLYGYAKPVSLSGTSGFIIADYKQQVNNQYGGNTYSSRTLNVYQPSSLYFEISNSTPSYTVIALQGDTFLGYFDALKGMWDTTYTSRTDYPVTNCGDGHSGQEVLYIPLETQVIQNNLQQSGDTGGLSVTYSLSCSLDRWICQNRNAFGFALLQRAGVEILRELAMSNRINSIVTLQKDAAAALQVDLMNDYTVAMDNALKNVDIPNDICFSCRNRITTTAILT